MSKYLRAFVVTGNNEKSRKIIAISNSTLHPCNISSSAASYFETKCAIGADEDPVDQKKYFEDSCRPKCVKPLIAYQACVKRIQGDEEGHKHCTGQYFDYWKCVDKCVAPKLFATLK